MNAENFNRYIEIKVKSEEEKVAIGSKIHEQLVGNKDYIDSNILVNIDDPLTVRVWFFDECESIPEICI